MSKASTGKTNRARIEEEVGTIASGLLTGTDFELVDVEYTKEQDYYLRVFIDKPGGIDLDELAELSHKLEAILDEKDFIDSSYILEVSSPGLDRPLKKPADFQREQGKTIDVHLFAPLSHQGKKASKILVGVLTGHSESSISLDNEEIELSKIAKISLHIDF